MILTINTLIFHTLYVSFVKQLEGRILLEDKVQPDDMDTVQMKTIDIALEHKNDDNVLHRLSTVVNVRNADEIRCYWNCNQMNVNISVAHTNKDGQLWTVIQDFFSSFLFCFVGQL